MVKSLEEVNQELSHYIFEAQAFAKMGDRENAKKTRDKVIEMYEYKKKHYELERDERKALKFIKIMKRGEDFKPFQNRLRKKIQSQVKKQ